MFTKALDTWLPQFKAGNGTTSSTSTQSSPSPCEGQAFFAEARLTAYSAAATTGKAPNGVSASSVHRFTRFYTLGICALFAILV
jgi:hypothetical protein